METSTSRKIFAGARIRRLRRDLGLTQAQMAEGLGISASYLNLVERDQRPLSAQLVLKLAETYDVNLRTLSGEDSTHVLSDLREVFADPLLEKSHIGMADLADMARNAPAMAQAVVALYRGYRHLTERSADIAERMAGVSPGTQADPSLPIEEVRDFYVSNRNYFPELEQAAESLWERELSKADDVAGGLRRHLRGQHGITVKVMPTEYMEHLLRRFDRHSSRLFLSELLTGATQRFQMAYQIALLEHSELIDGIIARAGSFGEETRRLMRTALANYFAGAVLMPYDKFLKAAEKKRYDIHLLCQRFDVSYEQACHRLTTLQRPGAQGISFFFIRIDRAGNISKRLSASGFHFATYGGACPRWNVHEAFQNPGRIVTQIVQMPDKSTYLSVSRTVDGVQGGYRGANVGHAVALGCDVRDASKTVYADAYEISKTDLATPIGPNCRLCERPECSYRAFPPINRAVVHDENTRALSPFVFREID